MLIVRCLSFVVCSTLFVVRGSWLVVCCSLFFCCLFVARC